MSLNQTKRLLREQIAHAFADVPYPGDDNIGYSHEDYESESITQWLRGRHWSELRLDSLLEHNGSLLFMTDEAYRYYLPAYLLACLEDAPDMVYEDLLATLTPVDEYPLMRNFLARVQGLTDVQKEAIKAFFVDAIRECEFGFIDDGATQALKRYWDQNWMERKS